MLEQRHVQLIGRLFGVAQNGEAQPDDVAVFRGTAGEVEPDEVSAGSDFDILRTDIPQKSRQVITGERPRDRLRVDALADLGANAKRLQVDARALVVLGRERRVLYRAAAEVGVVDAGRKAGAAD